MHHLNLRQRLSDPTVNKHSSSEWNVLLFVSQARPFRLRLILMVLMNT